MRAGKGRQVYQRRTYRRLCGREDFIYFRAAYKETDLYVGLPQEHHRPEWPHITRNSIRVYRRQLEKYIAGHPDFLHALTPIPVGDEAPEIVRIMGRAARTAGVGPMAAVAGAMAELVARDLMGTSGEIYIENGGDIYLNSRRPCFIGVHAGSSPLSNRLAIKIQPRLCPLGVCTSSGTVGHSLSLGRADAAVILAPSAALADAVATAAGNLVQKPEDVEKAALWAARVPGVLGALIIAEEKMALWGSVELVPWERTDG